MHPAAHDLVAEGAFRLGDLSLVVREDVVDAAGVDVEALAQESGRHRRALDVPAREAAAVRALPALQPAPAGSLPEREITRMPLAGVGVAAHAGEQLFGAVA